MNALESVISAHTKGKYKINPDRPVEVYHFDFDVNVVRWYQGTRSRKILISGEEYNEIMTEAISNGSIAKTRYATTARAYSIVC